MPPGLDSLRKVRVMLASPDLMPASVRQKLVATRVKIELKKRIIALLCGAVLGPGVGHVFLGRFRRALVWWVMTPSCLLLSVANASRIGEAIGFDFVVPILVGVPLSLWLSSVIDLFVIRPHRYEPVRIKWAIASGILSYAGIFIMPMFLNAYFIQAERVPSTSMLPTLVVGDHIVIDKRASDFHRGNVIVFPFPESPDSDFVKRVVAKPGDIVEVEDGAVKINKWSVPRCRVGVTSWTDAEGSHTGEVYVEYLDTSAYLTMHETKPVPPRFGPYKVAAGELFVLGDNRNSSHDSRFWYGTGSGVPIPSIHGKALFRWITVSKGQVKSDRIGTPLSEALLPAEMKELRPTLEKCLASRPAHARCVPPP